MIDDHLNINHLAAFTLPLVMTNIHINRKHTAISAVHIINVTSACVLCKLHQKSHSFTFYLLLLQGVLNSVQQF